jgi:hypothetical protein
LPPRIGLSVSVYEIWAFSPFLLISHRVSQLLNLSFPSLFGFASIIPLSVSIQLQSTFSVSLTISPRFFFTLFSERLLYRSLPG